MKRNLLVMLFAAFCARSLIAAEAPTITVSKSDMIGIAVSPVSGADGAIVTKTVQTDLALSGYFAIVPAGSATFTVGGASNGGSLDGKVTDHGGRSVVASAYSGTAKSKAHAFA